MMAHNTTMNDDPERQDVDPVEPSDSEPNQMADMPGDTGQLDSPMHQAMQPDQSTDDRRISGLDMNTPKQAKVVDTPQMTENRETKLTTEAKPTQEAAIPWFSRDEIETRRSQWSAIQTHFVDDPRSAVEQGDAFVAETMGRINQIIAEQHKQLNQQITNHNDLSTESLRILLQNYRILLHHLLEL